MKHEEVALPKYVHIDATRSKRRAWNWLLANAYDELPTAETHSIPVADLMKALGYTSRVRDHRVTTRGRRRSWRLASLAPLAFFSGAGPLSPV